MVMTAASHPTLERYYTPTEVSELIGVPVGTLRRWRLHRTGRLIGVRLNGLVRYPESELRAFLAASRVTARVTAAAEDREVDTP